jgi:hypothetical protein
MLCVLATDDDPRAKPDATHDRDHLAYLLTITAMPKTTAPANARSATTDRPM